MHGLLPGPLIFERNEVICVLSNIIDDLSKFDEK